jgi:putative ABC transport system permease protein
MQILRQDLRYATRLMLNKPGFTAVAVLTLALGIGANTTVYSVINAVLLRPLPYLEPEQIVRVFETNRTLTESPVSPPNFVDWKGQSRVFERMAAFQGWSASVAGPEGVEQIPALRISADFFPLLGVTTVRGRVFLPEDDRPGSDRLVILSHGLWLSRFGGDPGMIGKALTLDGQSFTVAGVLPRDFEFLSPEIGIWIPLRLGDESHRMKRTERYLQVIARLRPGVTLEQAQAEMNGIALDLSRQYPDANASTGVRLVPLHKHLVRNLSASLLLVLGAASFVLLIACANVTNLLLARASSRQKEVAIRATLGAGRWRVMRQLLTESALLFLLSGAIAVLLASWSLDLLIAIWPRSSGALTFAVTRLQAGSVDLRVLLFTSLVSLATGIVFGLAPAWQTTRISLNESLKEGGRSSMASLTGLRLRQALVVSEIAVALALLIGAGLLINSLWRLLNVNPGFNPERVVTMQVASPPGVASKEGKEKQPAVFFRDVVSRVEAVPGVQSASVINTTPLAGEGSMTRFTIENRPPVSPADVPMVSYRVVGPEYFRVMDIRLLQGRHFIEADGPDSTAVVIINETLARRFWPNASPIGQRIRRGGLDGFGPWYMIVGVISDVRTFGIEADPRPEIFIPHAQFSWPQMTLVARTAGDPSQLVNAIRAQIRSVNQNILITGAQTMEQLLSGSVAARRFTMALLSVFAGLALILAAVGIFGVMSYAVTERTREIGIRMALGARAGDVVKVIVRQGMKLALIGVVIGLAASFALTPLMSSLLFGVSPTDPVTFIVLAFLLAAVALAACHLPARRAAKVDPMVTLRYE